ncbi:MAG TPA: short-chain dehydrogenase, partial [Myxococcota bacterium]
GSRGQWRAGGSTKPGFEAYATSKQGNLATAMAWSRAHPRLRINAIEPGFSPSTGLGRDAPAFLRLVVVPILSVLAPLLIKGATTPGKAARVIADAVQNKHGETGAYYDEAGQHMKGSVEVSDPAFQDRVVDETRALLASV